ncbi:MAG: hypothetical protein FWF28_02715, partial [Micrococcales bacterium]|nr:hypothetical protein [Micrococcales bacterium]
MPITVALGALLLASVAAVVPVPGITDDTAQAVANVPAAPKEVYVEDFENPATAGTAVALDKNTAGIPYYTGYYDGATNMTYYADTPYSTGNNCDGIVLSYNNGTNQADGGAPAWASTSYTFNGQTMTGKCSPMNYTQSYNGVRTLARAMGQFLYGATSAQADNNHMVSSYTECPQLSDGSPGYNGCTATMPVGALTARMFETASSIPVTPNHYYTFGVDVVAGNCTDSSNTGTVPLSDPAYQFQLLNGSTRTSVGAPVDPCAAPQHSAFTVNRPTFSGSEISGTMTGYAAHLTANAPFFFTGSTLGVAMYNTSAATSGNDGGFDNVVVLDVTPMIDKSFSPAVLAPGQTSVLTLTVTNTTDLYAKTDWGFTDMFPAGLTLANTTFGGTCKQVTGNAYTVSGTTGGSTLTVAGGDLSANQTSCTITANVTSATEGTYTNDPNDANNMTLVGLVPGTPGTVQFVNPHLTLTKQLGSARAQASDQFTVAVRTGSSTGPVANVTTNSTTTGTGSTVTAGSGTTGAVAVTPGTAYYLT